MPIINDNTELYLDSASRYSFELYYSYDSLSNTNISIGTHSYDSLTNTNISIGTLNYDSLDEYIKNPEMNITESDGTNYTVNFKFNETEFIVGRSFIETYIVPVYLTRNASFFDILKEKAIEEMKNYIMKNYVINHNIDLFDNSSNNLQNYVKRNRMMEIE